MYRSTDGGTTWAPVPGAPTGFIAHKGVLDDGTGNLFVATSDRAGPYDGAHGDVWRLRRPVRRGTWTRVSPVPSTDAANNYFGYSGLSVDRQQPGTLMVTAYSSWWPDTQIFRSTDSGATWTRAWEFTSYPNRSQRYRMDVSAAPWLTFGANPSPPETTPKLGWMTEALAIDPFDSDRMMYGTGATIYGTDEPHRLGRRRHRRHRGDGRGPGGDGGPRPRQPAVRRAAALGARRRRRVPAREPRRRPAGDVPRAAVRVQHEHRLRRAQPLGARAGRQRRPRREPEPQPGGVLHRRRRELVPAPGRARRRDRRRHRGRGGGRLPVRLESRGGRPHVTAGFGGGWTPAQGLPAGAVVESDRVDPATFYGVAGGRFHVSRDGGATFTATAATGLPATGNVRFKAVPGRAGDVWLAGGATAGRRTACGTRPTAAPPSPASPASTRPTRSGSAGRRPGRRTRRSTRARGSAASAASSGPTPPARRGCGSTTTSTSGAGPAPRSPGTRACTAGSTSGRTAAASSTATSPATPRRRPPRRRRRRRVDAVGHASTPSATPGGGCEVGYAVGGQWDGGFQGEVRVRNTGATPVRDWRLTWTFPDGQRVTQAWGATVTASGDGATAAARRVQRHDRARRHGHLRLHRQLGRRQPGTGGLRPRRQRLRRKLKGRLP